ncbi:MAG: hypothetical protein CSB55_05205 [Candidatus Cloacimonadota bacterium]|nr:MAG: hypothetical protein CSB55_05205 [Candidatus Cloacimonadota bacterium]
MSNDTAKRGVLPLIEELKDDFNALMEEMAPEIDKMESRDLSSHFRNHFISIYSKMKELPDKVDQSYELVQSVIKSIQSSRSELKKSVDGLIKKTGMQLQKITSTTEEATNKILDIAEKLDEDQEKIIALIEKIEAGSDNEIFAEIKEKIYKNQESAFTIIDFLQFQDITAQQIAGAYALLSDTETTLLRVSNLLKEFDDRETALKTLKIDIDRNSFNSDAAFSDKKDIQNAIDDMFESQNTDVDIPDDKTCVKKILPSSGKEIDENFDIDALFDNKMKSEEKSSKDEDFDIDALFNNNNKKEENKTSQDEIDKLFG